MSPADIALVVFILIGAVGGYRQGFLMTLFSLAALILGILGAFKLMGYAIVLLAREFDVNETILPYVAFAVLFFCILIAVRLLGTLIKVSIDKTFLGRIDQAAGAGLGAVKSVFILSVLLWIINAMDFDIPDRWTADSLLLPRVELFAPRVTMWLAQYIPFFSDIFT